MNDYSVGQVMIFQPVSLTTRKLVAQFHLPNEWLINNAQEEARGQRRARHLQAIRRIMWMRRSVKVTVEHG